MLRAVVGVYASGEGVVGVLLTVLWMVLVELGHNIQRVKIARKAL